MFFMLLISVVLALRNLQYISERTSIALLCNAIQWFCLSLQKEVKNHWARVFVPRLINHNYYTSVNTLHSKYTAIFKRPCSYFHRLFPFNGSSYGCNESSSFSQVFLRCLSFQVIHFCHLQDTTRNQQLHPFAL